MSKQPCKVSLDAAQSYFWCVCGLSQNDPYCDGTHKGSGKRSLPFTVEQPQEAYLCMCKQTKNPPYCDGSHSQ